MTNHCVIIIYCRFKSVSQQCIEQMYQLCANSHGVVITGMYSSEITQADRPHNLLPNDMFPVAVRLTKILTKPYCRIKSVLQQCGEQIYQRCTNVHNRQRYYDSMYYSDITHAYRVIEYLITYTYVLCSIARIEKQI